MSNTRRSKSPQARICRRNHTPYFLQPAPRDLRDLLFRQPSSSMGVRREGGEVTIWFFCFLEKSTFVCVCLPTLCGVCLRLDFFFFFFCLSRYQLSLSSSLSLPLSPSLSRVIQEKNLPGQELIREPPPPPFQKKQPGPGLVGTHSLTHSPFTVRLNKRRYRPLPYLGNAFF